MVEIPPFKLVLEPLSEKANNLSTFVYADDEVGTRHQLGGKAHFLQQEFIPTCPDCREIMTFYAQLDSINDDICIADCGMIYVFICFECNTTFSFIQSS